MRGRSRGGGGGNGGGGGGGGGGKGANSINRSYESNGPDVKIRGTAGTIADKYVQLSRDALSAGDPVAAENYMQHAEHYYRVLAAAQAQFQPHQTVVRADADDFNDQNEDEDGHEGVQPQQGAPYANGGQNVGYQQNRNGNGGGRNTGGYNQGPRDGDQNRFDRRDARPERREGGYRQDNGRNFRDDNDRPSGERRDREPQPEVEAAPVGGLPAFITGGGSPAAEQPAPQPVEREARPERVRPERVRPERVKPEAVPEAAEAPVAEASAAEPAAQDDGDPRESGGPARGRRRRYGRRSTAGDEGAGDAAPQPEASAD